MNRASRGRRSEGERRLLVEHRPLELLERGARLDPELVDEPLPRSAVRLERFGLASRAVEREHELAAQTLAQRMLGNERLELADDRGMAPEGERSIDPLLDREQP